MNLLTQSESILQELKSLCSRLQSNSTSHRENSDTQEVPPSSFSAEGAFSTDVWDHSPLEAGSPPPASLFKQENPDDKEV